MIKKIFIFLIKAYQKTISPDHGIIGKSFFPGGACKYHPTCSQYSIDAISKHGIIKGAWLSAKRISRCNPFSKGGHDSI